MNEDPEGKGPLTYGPGTILTQKDLARWLQVSDRTVRDLLLPRLRLPNHLPRYSAGQVLAYLEGRDLR